MKISVHTNDDYIRNLIGNYIIIGLTYNTILKKKIIIIFLSIYNNV